MDTFIWISIFAVSAMVVNALGILVIYRNNQWAEENKEHFMCFAAGILITSPLISGFPEALSRNQEAGFAALFGFLFMYMTNRLITLRVRQTELIFGFTALVGIGIHSFVDGIVYSVTFTESRFLGFLAGSGLVIHEFAEGVITFSFLVKGGVSRRKAAVIAFMVAALTTPLGAFIIYPMLEGLSVSIMGYLLGFVAGVLIYISAAHLLPEAGDHKEHSYLSFFGGVLFSALLYFAK